MQTAAKPQKLVKNHKHSLKTASVYRTVKNSIKNFGISDTEISILQKIKISSPVQTF